MKQTLTQLFVASLIVFGLIAASGCGSVGDYYGPSYGHERGGYGYGGYGYVYSPYYYDGTAPPGQSYRAFNGYPY